jgi:Pyridoxamine 5'-phosphate oxidase
MAPTPTPVRLPDSYGITAVPGERLPWARVEQWLTEGRNYWVCTTRPDGRPHSKPVWGIWMDDTLLFSTDPASVTGRNLAANPAASIHLESGDEAAILEGEVVVEGDEGLLERFADAYQAKYDYRPAVKNRSTPVLAVRPRVVLSWTEADYPGTATRWVF